MRLADRIVDLTTRPVPLRTLIFRKLFERYPIGSYTTRLNSGAIDRPHYGLCMLNAALEAKALGHKAMTVVEMGVAGGNGLLCLCRHRDEIQKELGIEILVVGFDTGAGLPPARMPATCCISGPLARLKWIMTPSISASPDGQRSSWETSRKPSPHGTPPRRADRSDHVRPRLLQLHHPRIRFTRES